MKLRSFRLRIALLSAVLAGGALVGFGLISWWFIRAAEIDRLDAQLKNQVLRAIRPQGKEGWRSLESSLPVELGIDAEVPVALLVSDRRGQPLYQSDTWTTALNPDPLWAHLQVPALPLGFDPRTRPDQNPVPSLFDSPPPQRPTEWPFDVDLPEPIIVTQHSGSEAWRMVVMVSPGTQVAIAVSLDAVQHEMQGIRNLFLITIPTVLVAIIGSAWILAGKTLQPVQQLTHTIQQVTVKGLDQRVSERTADVEFQELIQVFNQMLERLDRSFHQALRFSGDAAHELKTPLAILQGELEQTIQATEDGSAVQQAMSTMLDEVRRLSSIVRKLLLLSLADAGQMRLHYTEINLSEQLTEFAEDIGLLAPDLTVDMVLPTNLKVWGDRDLLTQVLQNLISNAVKYNVPDGWIRITAEAKVSTVGICIRNSSRNIPIQERDRIFDRFYRGDPAHTRKVEGIGLGLSLAREIVRTHGGTLTLDAASPGQTGFTLTLPKALQPTFRRSERIN